MIHLNKSENIMFKIQERRNLLEKKEDTYYKRVFINYLSIICIIKRSKR